VRLGALQAKESNVAAGAERALYESLCCHHVRVVHTSIVAAHDDEGLSAGESGRPFQRALNEARITGSGDRSASEDDTEGERDCRKLHGGIPQTARASETRGYPVRISAKFGRRTCLITVAGLLLRT